LECPVFVSETQGERIKSYRPLCSFSRFWYLINAEDVFISSLLLNLLNENLVNHFLFVILHQI